MQQKEGKPRFCWLNTTHMHLRTHPKPSSIGQAGRWAIVDHDYIALAAQTIVAQFT